MDLLLSDIEVRVVASLVEKEITTPEYYPLSLNALVNACNQKNNREPVTSYEAEEVREAIFSLKDKGLVITCAGERVLKYDNYLADKLGLSEAETAVLNVLMLRGPQTPGELRARAERMHKFAEVADVEAVLQGLMSREEPLVVQLPRQAGRKEHRWAHLLGGEVAVDAESAEPPEPGGETIRQKVERLESELQELRREFEEFRREFQ